MIKYKSMYARIDRENMIVEPPKFRTYSEAMTRLLYASVIEYYYQLIAQEHEFRTGQKVCRTEEQE